MRFKKISITIAALLCLINVQAQSGSGKISGVVMDEAARRIPGVTVLLFENGDSLVKRQVLSNGKGVFHFLSIKNGNYTLSLSSVGFHPYENRHLAITDSIQTVDLPPIILEPSDARMLDKVTVTARKPLIEQKIDRIIVNVDAMLSSAGSNTLDIFEKSPGVIIDQNGNISLNGKNNVWVLIDDHPVYMSGLDLAAYLRSLPAGTVDKLELISSPPAKYDASGNAIINIVLKKYVDSGFNGALNLGFNQGTYGRSNDALNINYRRKKFNLFTNLGVGLDQNYNKGIYDRRFYQTDGSQIETVSQNSYYTYHSKSFNSRVGIDYFLSPRTTIGLIATGNFRGRSDLLNYQATQGTRSPVTDSISNGSTAGNYPWRNTGVNLNFQQQLDKKGESITANLDYLNYSTKGDQSAVVTMYNPGGMLLGRLQRQFTTPSDINIYAGKIDYGLPLKSNAHLDAGIKLGKTLTNAQSNWFNDGAGVPIPDYDKSNHFAYSELIAASYLSYRKDFKWWALQAGVRVEYTNARGHQYENPVAPDTAFARSYTSLVPSFSLQYKLDTSGNNNMVLTYSKRLRRPGYQDVNPFIAFLDPYTFRTGNPNLAATASQFIELRYSYKHYFGITLSYGGGANGINPLTRAAGNIFITTPYNYIKNTLYGLIPFVSVRPRPWWDLTVNAVLLYQVNRGSMQGITVDQHVNVHEIETSNHFKFGNTWSAELNGFFPGKQAFGQTASSSIYNISLGIQKLILSGNGTIRLNVNDIFHTMTMHSRTVGIKDVTAATYKETDSRWIGASFVYRFGKSSNARKRNDNGSAEEEKSRTN